MHKPLVAMSPRILRQVPRELGFRGKTLQYLEQSMAHCLMRLGARVAMMPTIERGSEVARWQVAVEDYVDTFDALILQGGADLDPRVYGEEPSAVLGPVDAIRDRFELELLNAFAARDKPVLGVCRGMQLINVCCGGSLHQDLQVADARHVAHYLPERYDEHTHDIELLPGGWLRQLYDDLPRARVNSIHHQGVKRLGDELVIDARSDDGVVECVRHSRLRFMLGVQWHPEFHDARFPELLPMEPLLQAFIAASASGF